MHRNLSASGESVAGDTGARVTKRKNEDLRQEIEVSLRTVNPYDFPILGFLPRHIPIPLAFPSPAHQFSTNPSSTPFCQRTFSPPALCLACPMLPFHSVWWWPAMQVYRVPALRRLFHQRDDDHGVPAHMYASPATATISLLC